MTFNLSALEPRRFTKRLGVLDAVLEQRTDTANRALLVENAAGNPILLAKAAADSLGPTFWRAQGFSSLEMPSDLAWLPFTIWVRPARASRGATATTDPRSAYGSSGRVR